MVILPVTVFFKSGSPPGEVYKSIQIKQLQFPLIAKPDIGMKGLGVEKLNNHYELFKYIITSKVDFLIQKWIDYKNEVGIFYYRYPDEQKGYISGIVKKEFLILL